MSAVGAVDLEDADGLIAADRDGLLRAASMAGAQVRSVAAAVSEGELDSLRGEDRVRSVIWVAGRGAAETAGALLAATLATAAADRALVTEAPPWVGPLDVLIVAGDDPGDPALVGAAATGVRRGSRVVVVAPFEGPLRDSTAGRVAVLSPRLPAPEEFGLCRYLAAGLAVLQTVDSRLSVDLAALADELDAEALRNSAGRDLFTNPAKTLAARMTDCQVALAGDSAATLALARHGSSVLLRVAQQAAAAAGLGDALAALRSGPRGFADPADALFHDEQIDGPLPRRLRVLALTLAAERTVVAARVAGFDDVYLLGAEDMQELPSAPTAASRAEQQLAVLAVRLEMAAVYLRLARG
ncbi:TobH protein [Mycobacterium sp. Z3061]|uniref:TobH protein n=1 Tax=Mycobacterium sp. Z3061 TaxID=3073562 RepID=UPI002872E487|nr:TobH protein [Mycobacterium sp. Z3061]